MKKLFSYNYYLMIKKKIWKKNLKTKKDYILYKLYLHFIQIIFIFYTNYKKFGIA